MLIEKISILKREKQVFLLKLGNYSFTDKKVEENNGIFIVELNKFKRLSNDNSSKTNRRSSSYKEHRANALASGADEGRDKLR